MNWCFLLVGAFVRVWHEAGSIGLGHFCWQRKAYIRFVPLRDFAGGIGAKCWI